MCELPDGTPVGQGGGKMCGYAYTDLHVIERSLYPFHFLQHDAPDLKVSVPWH